MRLQLGLTRHQSSILVGSLLANASGIAPIRIPVDRSTHRCKSFLSGVRGGSQDARPDCRRLLRESKFGSYLDGGFHHCLDYFGRATAQASRPW